MKLNLRLAYLYLFSAVGLIVAIIGSVRLVDLAFRVLVFKNSDVYEYSAAQVASPDLASKISTEEAKLQEEKIRKDNVENTKKQRQRDASGALSMILIGTPIYFYHWRKIEKER